ncbi:hypothetical protein HID58_003406, partial [Brassica napus]
ELAEEILSRVQLTSLSSVRSTCRKWGTLSQNRGIGNEGDFVDPSIKQVSILDQVEITQVFHCEGLLICITKDKFKILVWNPYLGQTRWIQPRNTYRSEDRDMLSDMKRITVDIRNRPEEIISFDFTTERFGKWLLPLPSKSHSLDKFVSLSCVREEQLAVLHVSWVNAHAVEIWVKNKIAPGAVSWIKFVSWEFLHHKEKQVAVGLDLDKFRQPWTETSSDQRANIIGQDGYSKPVNLGEVPNHGKREKFGFKFPVFGCQLCALMFQAQGNCNCSREHGKRAMLKSW